MEEKGFIVKMPGRTLKDIIYNLKQSIYYLKTFFWNVWWFRGFDYSYTLILLRKALMENLKSMQSSPVKEVDETRIPKEKKLKRAIQLLENLLDDDYAERCGYDYEYDIDFVKKENGLYELVSTETAEQEEHNAKAMNKAHRLEEREWGELFRILKKDMRSWWS